MYIKQALYSSIGCVECQQVTGSPNPVNTSVYAWVCLCKHLHLDMTVVKLCSNWSVRRVDVFPIKQWEISILKSWTDPKELKHGISYPVRFSELWSISWKGLFRYSKAFHFGFFKLQYYFEINNLTAKSNKKRAQKCFLPIFFSPSL